MRAHTQAGLSLRASCSELGKGGAGRTRASERAACRVPSALECSPERSHTKAGGRAEQQARLILQRARKWHTNEEPPGLAA